MLACGRGEFNADAFFSSSPSLSNTASGGDPTAQGRDGSIMCRQDLSVTSVSCVRQCLSSEKL